MTTTIVPGSLADVAQNAHLSLSAGFMAAEVIILVDTSGSMMSNDSRGGKSRYDVAVEELRKIQKSNPGRLAIIAFSDRMEFCPAGIPTFFMAETLLDKALRFGQPADGTVKFVVISDGLPDHPSECLQIAGTFESEISCVFVGPETDKTGRRFLDELARAGNGKSVLAALASDLAGVITPLLTTGT